MMARLGKYVNFQICLVVGGFSLKVQEIFLRSQPDVVIATPGRILDHLRNSMSIYLENLEILILDEADKLLEMGFQEEISEIISDLPIQKQTILLSATLCEKMNQLAKITLNKPKRIIIDPLMGLSSNLCQEFIRVKIDLEPKREAIILLLCLKKFKKKVLIFCPTKKKVHRLKLIFDLHKLKASEIHGNLTQIQRFQALKAFRNDEYKYLICTNLIARGIDLPKIGTVINMYFPNDLKTYLHRVGRTARAGNKGSSVTLVGENKRNCLKQLIKESRIRNETLKCRVLKPIDINAFHSSIKTFYPRINAILIQEKEEKLMKVVEIEQKRLTNRLKFEQEIFSQPKRTWFMFNKHNNLSKQKIRKEKNEEKFRMNLKIENNRNFFFKWARKGIKVTNTNNFFEYMKNIK